MYLLLKIVRIVGIFALGVVFGFYAFGQKSVDIQLPVDDTAAVLKALTKLSATKIPRGGLHCEVNGTSYTADGMTLNNDVLVGDFIAHYLSWSLLTISAAKRSLVCNGGSVQQCTWSFGEGKPEEGWDRILQFQYDQTSKMVLPQSLECIDVP